MSRKFIIALLPVAACVGIAPAQAAPTVKTVSVSGTVANACSLSATSVGLTVTRATGSTITIAFSPTTVTAGCNSAAGGILSVSSTRLIRQPNTPMDYTVRVSGWGANVDYTTAASAPAPTTRSKSGVGSSALTFTCAAGCTTSQINNNSTNTATITLGIAANP